MLQSLIILTGAAGGLALLMRIAGAALYDLKCADQDKMRKLHPYTRAYRNKPLVTVIVYARNSEASVIKCLESIVNSYKKTEILIIDNASADNTRKMVRSYIKTHKNKTIKLISKRRAMTIKEAYATVPAKQIKGTYVMHIDASAALASKALESSVLNLNLQPGPALIVFNKRLQRVTSLVGLLWSLELVVRGLSNKYSSASSSSYLQIMDGMLYKKSDRTLLYNDPLHNIKHIYDADALLLTTEPQGLYELIKYRNAWHSQHLTALWMSRHHIFSKKDLNFANWVRLPLATFNGSVALFLPVLLIYFLYLALYLHQATFYTLGLLALGLLILFAVWNDEHLTLKDRVIYISLLPLVQIVVGIYSFTYAGAILRRLVLQKTAQLSRNRTQVKPA
jgi:glycosyltransferase involved in cell wall biosynthesis